MPGASDEAAITAAPPSRYPTTGAARCLPYGQSPAPPRRCSAHHHPPMLAVHNHLGSQTKMARSKRPVTATLRSMPECRVSDDGLAIEFSLASDQGEHRFAVHPDGLSQILARLMGAQGEANQRAGRPSISFQIERYMVGGSRRQNLVTLTLSPAPDAHFEFALSPEAAQDISSGLAAASATIAPRDPKTSV